MKNDIKAIIDHFGIKNQQRKLQEEVFELNEVITEYETAKVCIGEDYFEEYSPEERENFIKHIAEEIADCYVLLNQIQEYYQIPIETILVLKQGKINRTLERIQNGYYDKKE